MLTYKNCGLIEVFWLDRGWDPRKLIEEAEAFKALAHRMEYVAEIEEIWFWNDSKGINPSVVLLELEVIKGDIYWIAGGKAIKVVAIEFFDCQLDKYIKKTYLIGETVDSLLSALKSPVQKFNQLDKAVYAAF